MRLDIRMQSFAAKQSVTIFLVIAGKGRFTISSDEYLNYRFALSDGVNLSSTEVLMHRRSLQKMFWNYLGNFWKNFSDRARFCAWFELEPW